MANGEKKFIIIGSDTFGKEDGIGEILIDSYLKLMNESLELPVAIFFLNAGVRLTTINENIIPHIKELEKNGVRILSCGTCLNYYNLKDQLNVGKPGGMSELIKLSMNHPTIRI